MASFVRHRTRSWSITTGLDYTAFVTIGWVLFPRFVEAGKFDLIGPEVNPGHQENSQTAKEATSNAHEEY